MNWHADYLMPFANGCSSRLMDFACCPRRSKSLAARAIMEHAQWLTESTGKGMKASKRAAREATAMQSINGSFPTEQDLITDVVTESRRNPQPQYRPL